MGAGAAWALLGKGIEAPWGRRRGRSPRTGKVLNCWVPAVRERTGHPAQSRVEGKKERRDYKGQWNSTTSRERRGTAMFLTLDGRTDQPKRETHLSCRLHEAPPMPPPPYGLSAGRRSNQAGRQTGAEAYCILPFCGCVVQGGPLHRFRSPLGEVRMRRWERTRASARRVYFHLPLDSIKVSYP